MTGYQSWHPVISMDDWMRQQEKRTLHQERRPHVTQASDLLGPGAGPYAIQIWDWNDDAAAFNGIFFANPDDGQVHSPDDSAFWIGETFGTEDGVGFQRLTEIFPDGTVGTVRVKRRQFITPAGLRVYSAWANA